MNSIRPSFAHALPRCTVNTAAAAAILLFAFSMTGCVLSPDPFGGGPRVDQQSSPVQFISDRTSREITGQVSAITDGDTIFVVDENQQQHKVKLAGIESPDGDQDLGERAKQNLFNLIYGKTVHVLTDTTDANGRLVGKVTTGNCDLGLEQIKAGFAWFDRGGTTRSEADRKAYSEAETAARNAKLNLWSKPNISPPTNSVEPSAAPVDAAIVGNKNSLIYHWQGCSGYAKVSPQNRVAFGSIQEAENAGYRPAKNCSTPKPGGRPNEKQTASIVPSTEMANTQTAASPAAERLAANPAVTSSAAGATARCRDGAFNYSQTRRGACSGHGGVAEWMAASSTLDVKGTKPEPGQQAPTTPAASNSGYTLGPRGGCYRLSDSGRKIYVDKSLCS